MVGSFCYMRLPRHESRHFLSRIGLHGMQGQRQRGHTCVTEQSEQQAKPACTMYLSFFDMTLQASLEVEDCACRVFFKVGAFIN